MKSMPAVTTFTYPYADAVDIYKNFKYKFENLSKNVAC